MCSLRYILLSFILNKIYLCNIYFGAAFVNTGNYYERNSHTTNTTTLCGFGADVFVKYRPIQRESVSFLIPQDYKLYFFVQGISLVRDDISMYNL